MRPSRFRRALLFRALLQFLLALFCVILGFVLYYHYKLPPEAWLWLFTVSGSVTLASCATDNWQYLRWIRKQQKELEAQTTDDSEREEN